MAHHRHLSYKRTTQVGLMLTLLEWASHNLLLSTARVRLQLFQSIACGYFTRLVEHLRLIVLGTIFVCSVRHSFNALFIAHLVTNRKQLQ